MLLVDDESLIRSSTAEILSELGHTVLEAGEAAAALAIIEAEAIDVLLTDIGLPGMSGSDLAAEARRRVPSLRIVFASGRDTAPAAKQDGLSDAILLVKPYNASDIAGALASSVRTT